MDTIPDVIGSAAIYSSYTKARRGELSNFTGIDSPYETPEAPELHLHTLQPEAAELVEEIVQALGLG